MRKQTVRANCSLSLLLLWGGCGGSKPTPYGCGGGKALRAAGCRPLKKSLTIQLYAHSEAPEFLRIIQ